MSSKKSMRAVALSLPLSFLLGVGCAHRASSGYYDAKELEARSLGSISKLTTQGGYWFASQPSQQDFALAKKEGFETIINLRQESELPWEERRIVEGLGMEYVHEPIAGVRDLTDERLGQLRELLRDVKKPAMIHCASSNRVGAIWYVSRVLDQGVSPDAALAEAKRAGLRSEALIDRVQKYVAQERDYRGF